MKASGSPRAWLFITGPPWREDFRANECLSPRCCAGAACSADGRILPGWIPPTGADDDDLIGVRAISAMRWLKTKTVQPSRARPLSRLRTQRTPSGSSPLTGSSKRRTSGSPSRAAAMPRRWVIARGNVPAWRRLTEVSPVISSTSPTRARGMLFVWASICRVRAGASPGMDGPGLQAGADLMEGPGHVMDMAAVHGDVPSAGVSRPMMAELLDGELCSGESDLGEQSGRGGLVCGHGEGVAAADRWAVAPCCPGQVYGPGAVGAHGAAVPLHRSAPAGQRLVKKTLHAAFGVGFPLVWGACCGDLDEFVPARGQGGVGEAVAGGVDPVIQVHDPEPARAAVGPQAQVERCHAGAGPGKRSVTGQLTRRGQAGGQDRRARGQGGYPCLGAYLRAEAGSSAGKKTDQGGPPAGHVAGAAA